MHDFTSEAPHLQAAAAAVTPWLSNFTEDLRHRIPLPRTVQPYAESPYFRPPGSYRCVYYCPSAFEPAGQETSPLPVVAMKGLEPAVADFEALLQDLQRACYSPHNIAEHLVFEEHKIPGCVGLREAQREAERAAAIQQAHYRMYGSLARLPLPLLVYRHSQEVESTAVDALRRHLSPAAFERVTPQLADGVGAYLYYYPTVPSRARDMELLLDGRDFRTRFLALATQICDPDDVIREWVRGFVRMLYLGFLPGSLPSLRTGICCQPQNACLDGGFVDLDSLTAIDELRDDTAVYAALHFSADSLLRTVRSLVAGSSDAARSETVEIRVDLHYIGQYVMELLRQAIKTEARPGLLLDPRILRYFTPARTVADLVERLDTYYSPKTDFDAAIREYGHFGLSLLRPARSL